MKYDRYKIVNNMQTWLGGEKGSKIHNEILSLYNSLNPLPRGYKLKSSDPWCAATVTAAFIKAGYTRLLPGECSCGRLIEQLKVLGEWIESDSYTPAPGDLIFYAWDDPNPTADNVEGHDHVGIVEFVEDKNIHTIEGNYNNMVRRRNIKINGKYIRGFGAIKYDDDVSKYYTAVKGDSIGKLCTKFGITKAEFIELNKDKVKAPLYWLYAGQEYRIR